MGIEVIRVHKLVKVCHLGPWAVALEPFLVILVVFSLGIQINSKQFENETFYASSTPTKSSAF